MKNETKVILTIFTLGIILLGYSFIQTPENIEPYYNVIKGDNRNHDGSTVGVTLILKHYRNGELLGTTVKENDYLLKNFAHYLFRLNSGNILYNDESVKLNDTGGTSELIWYSANNQIRTTPANAKIGIGTSTSVISLEDYQLGTLVQTDIISSVGYSVSSNKMNATFTSVHPITSTHTITEFGLYISLHSDNSINEDFLLCRDVIGTGINVINGDTLSVTYVFMFN